MVSGMISGEFGEARLIHSPGFIQLCVDRSGEPSEWAFLSSGNDGDVWLWGKEELEEVDYTPRSVGGRTHSAVAWNGQNVFVGHTYTDPRTGIEKSVVSKMEIENSVFSPPITSFALDVTTVDVSSSGSLLAAGAIDHIVKVIHLEEDRLSRLELDGQILCVAFDPAEEFLAVSTSDGKICVFKLPVENGSLPLYTTRLSSRITDIDISRSRLQLCWTPKGEFIFGPSFGSIKKLDRNFTSVAVSLTSEELLEETFSVCCASPCGQYVAASALSGVIAVWSISDNSLITVSKYVRHGEPRIICSMVWHTALDDTIIFADVEEHLCSLSKCTRKLSNEKEGRNFMVVDNDDDDTKLSADVGAIKKAYGFSEDGTFVEDFSLSDLNDKKQSRDTAVEMLQSYRLPALPKAFVSGATPDNLPERYLKWNRFGIIVSYAAESESSIEITWHDASIHPIMNIDNSSSNYTMGDLSNEAVALASKEISDEPSELCVIYIAAWNQYSREWKTSMALGEVIDDVAIGNDFVAVVTSSRFLRTFSFAGTQRMVISFPGVLATMCAAYDELALATYSTGCFFEEGFDFPQYNVTAHIYHIDHQNWFKMRSVEETVSISVGQGANLTWMGYNKEGELCSLDTKYCLRLLTRNRLWIPIFNFSGMLKSKSDGIWVVGVVERPEPEIRYVYCKGTTYPLVPSRPVPLIVKWQIPLCNPEIEKSKLEDGLILTEIVRSTFENENSKCFHGEIQELSTKYAKDIVRLFALSCKADRECRAAEFAWLAPSPQILQSLCNFAAKTRHSLLSEKVAEIGRQCNENLLKASVNASDISMTLPGQKRSVKLVKKKDFGKIDENGKSFCLKNSIEKDDGNSFDETDNMPMALTSSSSSDLTLASENVSQTPLERIKPPNPFKRKSANITSADSENIFDVLATPESRPSSLSTLSSGKKPRHIQQTSGQSVLSFSSSNLGKEKKTGFGLWLESVESDLKKEFCGVETEFLKFATKRFRGLSQFEKQRWNDAAGM